MIAASTRAYCTLTPHEFIRRFLSHVLPRGLVKIRHFGLLAPSNVKTKLAFARRLLVVRAPIPAQPLLADTLEKPDDWRDLLCALTGIDARVCQNCGLPQRFNSQAQLEGWALLS